MMTQRSAATALMVPHEGNCGLPPCFDETLGHWCSKVLSLSWKTTKALPFGRIPDYGSLKWDRLLEATTVICVDGVDESAYLCQA